MEKSPAEVVLKPQANAETLKTQTLAPAAANTETEPIDKGRPGKKDDTPGGQQVSREQAQGVRTSFETSSEPGKYFSLHNRIPLQIFDDESRGKRLSHWGPTLTSIVSIILTVVVWISAEQLSKRQIELQTTQTQLQSEQVRAELADMRVKFLSDLTATDEDKKIPAEIGLAGHGRAAMPIVHFAMGVEQGEIRKSAVNVFYRMFQAAMSFEERNQLLEDLTARIKSPNRILHTGIVQALVKVGPLLNGAERQKVMAFLQENVPPEGVCAQPEGRGMVREAATFFRAQDTNAVPYLFSIVRNPKCGDGWLQAMIKLEDVAAKQPQARADLLDKIRQTKGEVLTKLQENISEEDLTNGGFEGFIKEGQVGINFPDFQSKVEEEFNRVAKSIESIKR
jgi:hypothetical protein